jgi:TolB protein
MSYAQLDNEQDQRVLSRLAYHLSMQLRIRAGEALTILRYQDEHQRERIWNERIERDASSDTFLVAILTPEFFQNRRCRAELEQFLEREQHLGRDELVLPVYYSDYDPLDHSGDTDDHLVQVLRTRQHFDWRTLRMRDFSTPTVQRQVVRMARQVQTALGPQPEQQPEQQPEAERTTATPEPQPALLPPPEQEEAPPPPPPEQEEAPPPPEQEAERGSTMPPPQEKRERPAPQQQSQKPRHSRVTDRWRAASPLARVALVMLVIVLLLGVVAALITVPRVISGQSSEPENTASNGDSISQSQDISTPAQEGMLQPPINVGQIAFTSNRDGGQQIYLMNADGSNVRRLASGSNRDAVPAWSPDGRQIAFQSERDDNWEIYVVSADGGEAHNLTNNPAFDVKPDWSPGKQLIAFETYRDGDYEIYLMNADGSEQRNITNNPANDFAPAWSPDGSTIAFASTRDGNLDIYRMDANGSNPTRLTSGPGRNFDPAWSPDGSRIVFFSDRDGNQEIYTMNADGSNQQRVTIHTTNNDWGPVWSPDGQTLALVSTHTTLGGDSDIFLISPNGSNFRSITNSGADDYAPAWCCFQTPGSE